MKNEEYRLIEQILNGDRNSYSKVVDRYSPMVFHVVRGFEKDEDEVNELAQQIFVKAYEKLDSFQGESKLSSWLYSLAKNHCRDYVKNIRRNNSRFGELEPCFLEARMVSNDDPHRDMEDNELKGQLARAIGQLAKEHSEPLLMKYQNGLSYKVMSERLGVSESALKVRVHRARKELKSIIRDAPDGDNRNRI